MRFSNIFSSYFSKLQISSVELGEPCPELQFGIDYPKLSCDKLKGPFIIQGWVVTSASTTISKIEVVSDDRVYLSVPLDMPRTDVISILGADNSDVNVGFSAHLNPYLLPERFVLRVNAVDVTGNSIQLCTISGNRPRLINSSSLSPLLITTLGRTGSSALLGTLGMHPQISVYKPFEQEARYIGYYLQMFKTLSSAKSWQAPLGYATEFVSQEQLIGNVNSSHFLHYCVYEKMWDYFYNKYVPNLFKFCNTQLSKLYREVAKLDGKNSPLYMAEKFVFGNELQEVKLLFPKAKEIVLIRDPRDTYASILAFNKKNGKLAFGREFFEDNQGYLVEAFIPNVMKLYDYWSANRSSVLLVRYEDFIQNPHETLIKICNFINIKSSPVLIDDLIAKAKEYNHDAQAAHQTSESPFSSIERYKSVLSAGEISQINKLLCKPLIEFEYQII